MRRSFNILVPIALCALLASAASCKETATPPTGSVRIVNVGTGLALGNPEATWELVSAGKFYKIKAAKGRVLSLAPWAQKGREVSSSDQRALLQHVDDNEDAALLWDIKPIGHDSWTISNRASRQALEAPEKNPAGIVRQSKLRKSDAKQQWKLQPITELHAGKTTH